MASDYSSRYALIYSLVLIALCILFIFIIVDPLWQYLDLHIPGEPANKVDFTQLVDTAFYVRNIELGYRWGVENETSIWFHPLIIWLANIIPRSVEANIRLWIVSIGAGFVSIYLLYRYISQISPSNINPKLLILVALLPGGLGIATGNTEFLCLLFSTLLITSVMERKHYGYQLLWGALAILTKPNALYMAFSLFVYLVYGGINRDWKILKSSFTGILSIIVVWILWIVFVDIKSGEVGAYWSARQIATLPLSAGPLTFLQRTARILVYANDGGEKLKFMTALILPMMHVVLLLHIRLASEIHRLSILVGLIGMIAIMFLTNNPNKIIVYGTTFPGFLAIGILFIKQCFQNEIPETSEKAKVYLRYSTGILYMIFCLEMWIFYIVGTPLGWYF